MTPFRYQGDDLEALAVLPNYQDWIVSRFKKWVRGNCLEVGAGNGAYSALLAPWVSQFDLLEPSPNQATRLRERFHTSPHVCIHEETLEQWLATTNSGKWETMVMINCLEHIQDDEAALTGMAERLQPGGTLVVFVPALPALFSDMDRQLGHWRRYTMASLADVVEKTKLEVIRLEYMDMLGILPWWLVFKRGRKLNFDPRMARIYDRIGVPLTRTFEKVFSPPWGKNLLVVAKKGTRECPGITW